MEYIVNSAHVKAATMCGIVKPSSAVSKRSAPKPEQAAPRTRSEKTSFGAVLAIISSESGIPLAELEDSQTFDDLGVDSLLSLLIISRIRDELDIALDNSILVDLRSIGALRAYLVKLDVPSRTQYLDTIIEPSSQSADGLWSSILEIISQEAGVAVQDLSENADLADLGIDSLLSLIISSRVQEELSIEISHTSLFVESDTIGGLKAVVERLVGHPNVDNDDASSESASDSSSTRSSWPSSAASLPETPLEVPDISITSSVATPTARPLFIQGKLSGVWNNLYIQLLTDTGTTKTATERLFLFPDGGGSATSYANLPLLSPDWAVIAFDSPFVRCVCFLITMTLKFSQATRNPQLMEKSTLDALLETYLTALRSQQPRGPYHLGGWSAGGIIAYALASRLLAANEEVSTLILIDSPSPAGGLDRLPQSFFDHCSRIGIFESEMNGRTVPLTAKSSTPPQWLIPHFHATIELLHHYRALPLPLLKERNSLRVTIIWAGACAFDDAKYAHMPDEGACSATEMEGIRFLTQQRTDFGPGKWAQLFSSHEVVVRTIEGENHFSMMRRGAPELAHVIRAALNKSNGQ